MRLSALYASLAFVRRIVWAIPGVPAAGDQLPVKYCLGVMKKAIEDGGGNGAIAVEDSGPLFEGFVRGNDDGTAFARGRLEGGRWVLITVNDMGIITPPVDQPLRTMSNRQCA